MVKVIMKNAILFNSYENPALSALFPFPFFHKDVLWKSIEHFYQYHKLAKAETELRQKIILSFDPYKAKHFGSKKAGGKPRADYEQVRLQIMRKAIKLSYDQNPLRQRILKATKTANLVHLAQWDDFWGWYDGKGQNQFGILLMQYRDTLK